MNLINCCIPQGCGSFFITSAYKMSNTDNLFNHIRNGDSGLVEKLLATDHKLLESKDQRGSTPLLLAAYYGHGKLVELLLKKGAEVDAKDGSGNTALMGVCFKRLFGHR